MGVLESNLTTNFRRHNNRSQNRHIPVALQDIHVFNIQPLEARFDGIKYMLQSLERRYMIKQNRLPFEKVRVG